MKLVDFKIGSRFKCGSKLWMCTDIGTRVVTAVCLTLCRDNDWGRGLPQDTQDKMWSEDRGETENGLPEVDPSWLSGPPYALGESVFDEFDQQACEAL